MKFKCEVLLKEGFRQTCAINETVEMTIEFEANNYVTANWMFTALTANLINIDDYNLIIKER